MLGELLLRCLVVGVAFANANDLDLVEQVRLGHKRQEFERERAAFLDVRLGLAHVSSSSGFAFQNGACRSWHATCKSCAVVTAHCGRFLSTEEVGPCLDGKSCRARFAALRRKRNARGAKCTTRRRRNTATASARIGPRMRR